MNRDDQRPAHERAHRSARSRRAAGESAGARDRTRAVSLRKRAQRADDVDTGDDAASAERHVVGAGGVVLPDLRRRVPEAVNRRGTRTASRAGVSWRRRVSTVFEICGESPCAIAASTIWPPPCRGQNVGYTDSRRIGRPSGFSLIPAPRSASLHGAQSGAGERLQAPRACDRPAGSSGLASCAARGSGGPAPACRAPRRRSRDGTDPTRRLRRPATSCTSSVTLRQPTHETPRRRAAFARKRSSRR